MRLYITVYTCDSVGQGVHALCRYELEQQLLAGDISIQDVPRLWNEKMTEYLGCTPKDDAQGVLQDVHWSAGIMGYFPTYSLGAMYACQIYQVCTYSYTIVVGEQWGGWVDGVGGWVGAC